MASAAVTAGWQCPTFDTENPASMSTYSLPSASQTRAPLPRTIAGGPSNGPAAARAGGRAAPRLGGAPLPARPVRRPPPPPQQLPGAGVQPPPLLDEPVAESSLVHCAPSGLSCPRPAGA